MHQRSTGHLPADSSASRLNEEINLLLRETIAANPRAFGIGIAKLTRSMTS
jgi:hypothetical protein